MGIPEKSYEYQTWFWEDYYPDGLPFTEEEYKALDEMDIDEAYETYYKYFGYDVIRKTEIDQNGIKGYVYRLDWDGITNEQDITLFINGQCVKFWTETETSEDAPYIAKSLIDSIH